MIIPLDRRHAWRETWRCILPRLAVLLHFGAGLLYDTAAPPPFARAQRGITFRYRWAFMTEKADRQTDVNRRNVWLAAT